MLIAHRINTIEQIQELADDIPIEFDIRDSGTKLLVKHDPYVDGLDFDLFLPFLKTRFTIINIKSEGIEHRVLEQMKQNSIPHFFLLDCSIPMIYKLTSLGEKRIAIRFSEFETLESVLCWKDRVDWVWVDCFHSYILTKEIEETLHNAGFKLCIVSPELQGRPQEIEMYHTYLKEKNIHIDAVCTKYHTFSKWSD
jgi:hypothetical protein